MKTRTRFFSIIIPALDEQAFLPKLLACLLKQSYQKFEIIVVDGKSKDGTVTQAEKFNDAFATLSVPLTILTSPKRNVSYQRNLGAKSATGTYFIFLDADVLVQPDFLQKIHTHIQKHESLLMTTWLTADSGDAIDELLVTLLNYTVELFLNTNIALILGFNTIVERHTFFAIGGFDARVNATEDHLFSKRARKKGIQLRFLKEPILTVSLRRFRSEGRTEALLQYLKFFVHNTLNGSAPKRRFDYSMGGAYHLTHKRESTLSKIKTMIRQ